MQHFIDYDATKERFRANVRQLLIYVFLAGPLLVAVFSGSLKSWDYLADHFANILFASLLVGCPIGLAIFVLYKILGFAFPSLDFTHRYRR